MSFRFICKKLQHFLTFSFQLKKNGHLLLELQEIQSQADIVDIDGLIYSMVDFVDVYRSREYEELARRSDTTAKQIVSKDWENRKKKFF